MWRIQHGKFDWSISVTREDIELHLVLVLIQILRSCVVYGLNYSFDENVCDFPVVYKNLLKAASSYNHIHLWAVASTLTIALIIAINPMHQW